jgi:uncharacterized protein YjbJ (UPF0337 family)
MAEGKFDEVKGRAKEAAGDLTDNPDLEREGKVDRAAGSVKGRVASFVDKVRGVLNRDRSASGPSPQR